MLVDPRFVRRGALIVQRHFSLTFPPLEGARYLIFILRISANLEQVP